jgi:hypothetical protein
VNAGGATAAESVMQDWPLTNASIIVGASNQMTCYSTTILASIAALAVRDVEETVSAMDASGVLLNGSLNIQETKAPKNEREIVIDIFKYL